MIVILHSTTPAASCPLCGASSSSIHSHYRRAPTDLPWGGHPVKLILRVRRFFCKAPSCTRRIFTERLSGVVAPWARTTQRLTVLLRAVAFALGGEAGARLAKRIGLTTSPATLISLIRRTPLPDPTPARVLGVDDWGATRGRVRSCWNSVEKGGLEQGGFNPGFCPRCPTGLNEERPGRCSRARKGRLPNREGTERLPAPRRSGARAKDGMVNGSEPLVNVVIDTTPKVLRGVLCGPVRGFLVLPTQTKVTTGEEAEPNPSVVCTRNVVSPSPSRKRVGASRDEPTGRRVEEEGESERRSVTERIGVETLSHAKAGRLPSGLSARESMANRQRRQGR